LQRWKLPFDGIKISNFTTKKLIVIIPVHDEVARGTLKSILEQANIDIDYFPELLK
jgi:hypothetical protein